MNSEKVKEIKKALECMSGLCKDSLTDICFNCEVDKKFDEESACKEALTLINELESENESLQDLCNKTYENLTKEIDRLENYVKELEDGIAKSMLGCEFLPECTNEKLKQFVERLKEKIYGYIPKYAKELKEGFNFHGTAYLIDETLKEFIKD